MRAKNQSSKIATSVNPLASSQESMVADAETLLTQAAECAVRLKFSLDAFMQAAHVAYLEASPATRERMEAAQLTAHLDDLRRRGVLATA